MTLVLVILSLLVLATAAVALSLRNLVHSALLLVTTWAGIAGVYLWAGAEFVGFAQVLVYVGAVSMVVLFAVLLTRRAPDTAEIPPSSRTRAVIAVFAGGAVAAVLTGLTIGTPFEPPPAEAPQVKVNELGVQLMSEHAVSLLVIGVLLTVALIGATILASTEKTGDAAADSTQEDAP